jgi:hypothetical protein
MIFQGENVLDGTEVIFSFFGFRTRVLVHFTEKPFSPNFFD